MRKKLPIGIDWFEKVRTNDFYYVDKTGFIADLLRNWGEVNLFTRPRRFGKTLIMSMLKSFFEIDADPMLFDGLEIAKEEELCREYMGKFPVVFVTLKGVDGLSYQQAVEALRFIIGEEAMRFSFLEESEKLTENEKNSYRALVNLSDKGQFTMEENVILTSLKTLSRLLSRHYGCKVILLIDEYDVPLDKAFQFGYYDEMILLIRNLFSNAFKTNEYLQFAVLTGCLRISKESIFTGLNNLNVMTITDSYFNQAFGFTNNEVKELLAYYGSEDLLETVRDWYDGYQFGGQSIYCPWDVIKYTQVLIKDKEAEPGNYWANTSGNVIIRNFISKADRKTKGEIERLIAGESVRKPINQELTYGELYSSIDNLWSVLFTTGYLTQRGKKSEGLCEMVIPNREIRDLFVKQIQEWFKEEARTDVSKLGRFCAAFPAGDASTIQELLGGYLWKSISIRDTAVRAKRKENFYHGMLLGLLQYESNWDIASNVESGDGYSDILLWTEQGVGVVIEIKYAEHGNLEKSCQDALKQIEEKKYDDVLRKDGIQKIIRYGIAFYKKNCKVMTAGAV